MREGGAYTPSLLTIHPIPRKMDPLLHCGRCREGFLLDGCYRMGLNGAVETTG
jgi:hypothetical protein